MAELQLKSRRFRDEREADWRRLETLLKRVEAGSPAKLSRDELLEIPVLYRQALSSLSVARSISLDQALVEYLESLCARAYFLVYGVRSTLWERISRFFAVDWPQAVRGLGRETAVAGAIMLIGVVVAGAMTAHDPEWFYAFVDKGMASGRDPAATTDYLRGTLYHDGGDSGFGAFATFLFTHNAQVALMAFALGFALCVPTAALMFFTGGMLGAFVALFASRGLGVEAVGWLMIHGTTELFAVVLAGAAGLSIGWSVAFPGERSRLESATHAGRQAGLVMAGVVVMLFAAGLLEGFGRQLIRADAARYAIAVGMAVLWAGYFYLPRRAP